MAVFILMLLSQGLIVQATPLKDMSDATAAKRGLDCGYLASFYGLEYAVLGYNSLYGYPKENDIDPGWGDAIFELNFHDPTFTSDCSNALPNGFDILRFITCDLNFKAEEVRTMKQLDSSLSTAASVSGGGFGVSFSASAHYDKSFQEIWNNAKIITISDATCKVFSTKFDSVAPPPFSQKFLNELQKLEQNDNQATYSRFFKLFGTHYATEIEFGARYTRESIMTVDQYKRLSESSYSVAAQAEFEGAFSVGGGFSLSTAEKKAARNFRKNVQVKEYTIGSLPVVSGNHVEWASEVHDTPVPIKYKLSPIEDLFTSAYFSGHRGIDYATIKSRITKYKAGYCSYINLYEMNDFQAKCDYIREPYCNAESINLQHGRVTCGVSNVEMITDGQQCTLRCLHSGGQTTVTCSALGDSAAFVGAHPHCGP